jgi:hypothetical protein
MPVHYAFRGQSVPPAGRLRSPADRPAGRVAADVRCMSHRLRHDTGASSSVLRVLGAQT